MPNKKPRKRKADDQTQRLRAILGGTEDHLPCVGLETLRRFHAYLVDQVSGTP